MKRSPLKMLIDEWEDCVECDLHDTRTQVVQVRGKMPCDVMFIGEAPGESEDVIGRPLIGPAGRLLDQIIEKALGDSVRVAYANLLGCIPIDEKGDKVRSPEPDWILPCQPRLNRLIELGKPKLIAMLGKVPHEWLSVRGTTMSYEIPRGTELVRLDHPAFILRAELFRRQMLCKSNEVRLRNAYNQLE